MIFASYSSLGDKYVIKMPQTRKSEEESRVTSTKVGKVTQSSVSSMSRDGEPVCLHTSAHGGGAASRISPGETSTVVDKEICGHCNSRCTSKGVGRCAIM